MFDRLAGERDGMWVITALRRRWWVIVLVAAVAGVGAHVLSGQQAKKYQATSAILFLNSPLSQELFGKQIVSNLDPARQAATNQSLVELSSVARLVAAQLHVPASTVESEVAFGSDAESDVLPITVTDGNPAQAAAIANAYVQQYIAFRKADDVAQLNTAESLLISKLAAIPPSQQSGPVAQALVGDRNQLDLLKSAQTGDAQVVQTATVPGSPSSPNPSKDTIIGVLLGLLVGAALVAVLERRDRRIKTPAEVEQIYGAPVIGTVPESNALRGGRVGTAREEEAFLMVRAQLRYFDVDRHIRRVMITSAESGEGKSLVSLNLARAAARTDDRRALLIEADLRRPSLHKMIGRDSGAGLAELLSHSQDLESGLRELVVTSDQIEENERSLRLDILLAGSTPPNPIELLESERMVNLLEHADSMYDIIIIDTPPIGIISDAIPLIHQVDGLLVISRLNYSRRDHATRLMKRLRGLNAHILGVIINSFRSTADASYGYSGTYPTSARPDERPGRGSGRRQRSMRTR
jgi:capsular exopolysaccharide synthesis family protein